MRFSTDSPNGPRFFSTIIPSPRTTVLWVGIGLLLLIAPLIVGLSSCSQLTSLNLKFHPYLHVTTSSWFGLVYSWLSLVGLSIFSRYLPTWPCICSPVWIYLWLQPHGLGLVYPGSMVGWFPPIFRLPAHLWPCICSPVWIFLWLQPHGFGLVYSWLYCSWMVPPYFQATCLPLALHLFTCMDLLVTTASWVGFSIFRALAGWSGASPYFQATCIPLALHLFTCMNLLVNTASWVWFGISMALAGWSAYVHLYGSTCDYRPMGLICLVHVSIWLVSPYFQATCLPLALHFCSHVWIFLWPHPHGFGLVYPWL